MMQGHTPGDPRIRTLGYTWRGVWHPANADPWGDRARERAKRPPPKPGLLEKLKEEKKGKD